MSRTRRPAILWDMDGTLVDSEPLHKAALVNALEEVGLTPPPDFHQHMIGRDAREVHGWCRDHLGLDLSLRDWLHLTYRSYLAGAGDLEPRGGAVDLFRRLQKQGYVQAIVSNSDRIVVNANLDATGLSDPGLITISRNDVRDGKPGAEPYLRAAWLLGLDPRDCVVVEDSQTGARAGLAAGIWTFFWPETDLVAPIGAELISSLTELEAAMETGRVS